MNFQIKCAKCEKTYRVTEKLFGKTVPCAACGHEIRIPNPLAKRASSPQSAGQPSTETETKTDSVGEKAPPSQAKPAEQSAGAAAASAQETSQASPGEPGVRPEYADLDSYELDAPEHAEENTGPAELGYTVEPQTELDEDDELELEPPIEAPTLAPILDEEDLSGGTTTPPKRRAPAGNKPGTPSQASNDDPYAAAEGLMLDDSQDEPKQQEPTKPCPNCQGESPQSAVLCVNCGLNLRTGQKVEGTANNKKRGFGKLFGRRDK